MTQYGKMSATWKQVTSPSLDIEELLLESVDVVTKISGRSTSETMK